MIIFPYQGLRFLYLDSCEWVRPMSAELERSFLNVTTLESRAKIWPVKLIITPPMALAAIRSKAVFLLLVHWFLLLLMLVGGVGD